MDTKDHSANQYSGRPAESAMAELAVENYGSSLQTAEFSLLPTTQTTTVTTTTTISTKFPPIVFKKPLRRVEEWDPTVYPLRDAPTPTSLRRFTFELDGSAATFVENEQSGQALVEVR